MKKKKMDRFAGVLGSILVLTGLAFLAVCVEPVSAASKNIVLKAVAYTAIERKGAVGDIVYGIYIDTVNKRAKGELEIKYLGAGEVIPGRQQMEACRNGVVDMVYMPGAYYQSMVPHGAALGISQLTPWEERESGFYDLIVEEHKKRAGVIPLGRTEYGVRFHIFSNKKIEKMADFKGLKFRSNAAYDPFFKKFGVVTVELPSKEIYTAMERGLVVGFSMPVFISDRWQLHEVSKYRINPGFWNTPTMHFINQKKFESLPVHLQNLLLETAKEIELKEITPLLNDFLAKEDKRQLDAGMEFLEIPPDEVQQYLEVTNGAKWQVLNRLLPEDEVDKIRKMITK